MARGRYRPPKWVTLLLRQPVIEALAVGKVAGTPQLIHILDLNSAGVVDGFPVTARTRQLAIVSTHERMLSQKEGTEFSGCEAAHRG